MINSENTKKLYRGIIEGNELTTKALNSYGFNSRDINCLIEQGKIRRVKRGHYEFLDVESLFHYGKYLVRKDRSLATKCFKKCHELDGKHGGACFQLFINCILAKDYDGAFEYFDVFYESDRRFYKNDANLYLFLLSHITSVPERYHCTLENLSIKDIRVDFEDKRYSDSNLENTIRKEILKKRFMRALNLLVEKSENNKSRTLQDFITRALLRQAVEKADFHKIETMKLAREKKYESLLEIFQQIYCPTDFESYIVKLLKTILKIKETNDIPRKTEPKTNYLYDLIDSNNFEFALKINTEFYIQRGVNPSDNILNVLLTDICEMIRSIETSKVADTPEEKKEDPLVSYANLFLESLKGEDYDKAFEYFDIFCETGNKNDYKFYLYLLSHITSVPERYLSTLENLSIEDIRIDSEDNRYSDSNLENRIRMNALQKKFMRALNLLVEKIDNNKAQTLQDFITRALLRQAVEKTDFHKIEAMKLARKKEYESLLEIFQQIYCPTDFESYMVKLLSTILRIKETNDIPRKTKPKSNNLYDLIDSNNFELALKINTEFYIQRGASPSDNILNVLLTDICEMIKSIESRVEASKTVVITEAKKESPTAQYAKMFFESLKGDDFEAARKYLNMLSQEEQTSQNPMMTQYLHNLLSSSMQIISSKKSSTDFSPQVESVEPKTTLPTDDRTNPEEIDSDSEIQRDIEYIETVYQSLISGEGMILLETCDQERTKRLLQIAEYYPDVESYVVEDEQGQRRVMMRYVSLDFQRFDYKESFNLGRIYYEKEEYDKCIEEYMRLLQLGEVRAYTYAMIGLSYMNKKDFRRAIDFLIVATNVGKQEKSLNYYETIKRLKKTLAIEENKPESVEEEALENYDLEIITAYILEFNLDVETACRNLGISPDTTLMVLIDYAKAYYTQGEFAKGDQFLKVVEKSKCKTEESLRALKEVQRDKKFYAHRTKEKKTLIPHTIKPVSPKESPIT